jgi:large subunit ribosomal protein L29
MRAEEIRELSADEIRARVAELEEERFRLRFRSATETL